MKRKLVNRLLVGALVLASALPLAGNVSVYAKTGKKTGWVMEGDYWHYYNSNGEMVKDDTITEGDQQYYVGPNGNFVQSEENKKALKAKMKENDVELKTKTAEYRNKYPETNECSEDYKKRDNRWTNKGGNWYFNWTCGVAESAVANDWSFINGFWYHFNKEGVMDRNITIKDKCNNDCILNADGVLINREEPDLGYWDDEYNYVKRTECGRDYYINGRGEKKLGWILDHHDEKWYYANKDGVVQKNKTLVDGNKKYVLGEDGAWIQ